MDRDETPNGTQTGIKVGMRGDWTWYRATTTGDINVEKDGRLEVCVTDLVWNTYLPVFVAAKGEWLWASLETTVSDKEKL